VLLFVQFANSRARFISGRRRRRRMYASRRGVCAAHRRQLRRPSRTGQIARNSDRPPNYATISNGLRDSNRPANGTCLFRLDSPTLLIVCYCKSLLFDGTMLQNVPQLIDKNTQPCDLLSHFYFYGNQTRSVITLIRASGGNV
jgi:hypothetical protein